MCTYRVHVRTVVTDINNNSVFHYTILYSTYIHVQCTYTCVYMITKPYIHVHVYVYNSVFCSGYLEW